jgi:hypothetical protein
MPVQAGSPYHGGNEKERDSLSISGEEQGCHCCSALA